MIILPDDVNDKSQADATLSGSEHVADRYNSPPSYADATAGYQSSHHQHTPPAPARESSPSGYRGYPGSTSGFPQSRQARFAFAPLTRPTNYISIQQLNSAITGTYSIDPTLPAPPGAVKWRANDGRDLNLRLFSLNGSIRAVVDIVGSVDSDATRLARLETRSQNGNLDVTVYDRGQTRFRLRVASQNGSANIRIPKTFVGSVHSRVPNGRLRFRPEVQDVTTLSESRYEKRHFIGDFAAHGYHDEDTWRMDYLDIEAQNGSVTVSYSSDEPREERNGSFGVGSWFPGLW